MLKSKRSLLPSGTMEKDEQRETVSRVPVLHAVPFIDRLFKARGTDNVKTDSVGVYHAPDMQR